MQVKKIEVDMKIETRVALLEQSMGHINETLLRIEKRFDKIDDKFDKMDDKLEKFEAKFDKKFEMLESKIDTHRKWLYPFITSIFFSAATLAITIYKIFNT